MLEADLRTAARVAYETNRFGIKRLEEKSDTAWSCSCWRISRILFAWRGFAIGRILEGNCNVLIRAKEQDGAGSTGFHTVAILHECASVLEGIYIGIARDPWCW